MASVSILSIYFSFALTPKYCTKEAKEVEVQLKDKRDGADREMDAMAKGIR